MSRILISGLLWKKLSKILAPGKSADKILKNWFLGRSRWAESVPKKLKNSVKWLPLKKIHKMPPGGPTKKKINFISLRNQCPCIVDPLKPISKFVEQDKSKNNMLVWVFGVELELSGGELLSLTCVNLLKKFGACKTSWEFYEKVIFGLISTVWIQIWPQFVQENLCSWVINLGPIW